MFARNVQSYDTLRIFSAASIALCFGIAGGAARAGAIGESAPVKLAPPQPYVWGNAIMGGVENATGVLFNPKHPEYLYSKNDTGSIYRFDRKGRRWISLMDNIPWSLSNLFVAKSIGLDADRPNTIYVAGGGSQWDSPSDILKTTDGGKHWRRTFLTNAAGGSVVISQAGDKPAGEQLSVDPNDGRVIFFGSQRDGLFVSRDAAKTWRPSPSFPSKGGYDNGIDFILFDWRGGRPGSPTQTIYAGVHAGAASGVAGAPTQPGGVYRSGDGGRTWALLDGGPGPENSPLRAKIAQDGTLYVTYLGPKGGIWKHQAGRWTDITPPGFVGKPFSGVGVHPTDAAQLLAITFDERILFYSRNGGASWTQYKHIAHDPASSNIILGFMPGWEMTDDQWPRGYSSTIEFDPLDPTVAYETDFSGVNIGHGLGSKTMTWSLLSAGREQMTCGDVVSPSAGAPLISGVWDVGGFRHESPDRIPERIIPLTPGSPGGQKVFQDIFQLDANPEHPDNLVAAGGWQWNNTGLAAYSNDNGRTLHNFPAKPFPDAKYGRIAIGTDPNNVVWAPMGTDQTPLYFTRDNGQTWTAAQGAPLGTVASNGPWSFYKELAADRVRPGVFYLYDRRDGGFFRSEDGGATWKRTAELPRQQGVHFDSHRVLAAPSLPGVVWLSISGATAAGAYGLYVSRDGGDTWTRMSGVAWAESFAFGKGKPGSKAPAAYLLGQIGGAVPRDARHADVQLYRSDDLGLTWTRINDDGHQFAGFNSMTGDAQTWGRVYLSTNGRGVFYGRPAHPER